MSLQISILTYHFPPKNHIASRRPLYLVHELIRYGYEVKVVTNKWDGKYTENELELLTGVEDCISIQDPLNKYQRNEVHYKPAIGTQSVAIRVSSFILKSVVSLGKKLLYPDWMVVWSWLVYLRLKAVIEKPDLIWCTAPPYSLLFTGYLLSKKWNCKLIIDYRDTWTENQNLFPKKQGLKFKITRHLERFINNRATLVSGVQMDLLETVQKKKFIQVLNGYPQGYLRRKSGENNHKKNLRIGYFGTFYGESNPEVILNAMVRHRGKNPSKKIELHIYGSVLDYSIKDRCNELGINTVFIHEKVKYEDALVLMSTFDLLLVITRPRVYENQKKDTVYTGKIFDYICSGSSILAICSKPNVIEDLLMETRTGVCFSHQEVSQVAGYLERVADEKANTGCVAIEPDIESIKQYSREAQNNKLIKRIEDLF